MQDNTPPASGKDTLSKLTHVDFDPTLGADAEPVQKAAPEPTPKAAPEPTQKAAPPLALKTVPKPTPKTAPKPAQETAAKPTQKTAPEPAQETTVKPAAEENRDDDAGPDGEAKALDVRFEMSKQATIMLVDDEPIVVDSLKSFLEDAGYQNFVSTTDPKRAMELLEKTRPDVVLLDVMMPEVTGLDILNLLRADDALKHIPAIVLTAATDAATKLLALGLGATDVLGKPVDPSELALRVRNTLTAKAYQDRLVNYDELTGLPNRRFFMERFGEALKHAENEADEAALLLIGLDHFKQINDSFGDGAGDALLNAVAAGLEDHIRESDLAGESGVEEDAITLSRIGGDEFALVIPRISRLEHATRVARRILTLLEKPFNASGQEIFVTASIGIAIFPLDGEDIGSLLKRADAAMKRAKESGRNSYQHHSKELNFKSRERQSLEAELRNAPTRQQLYLSFEPKVEVETGRVLGAEGSVRWKHPKWGIVPPDKFTPIAEETGLIVPLGERALSLACELNKRWQSAGIEPVRVSVSISGQQFHEGEDFVVSVRKALVKTGLASKFLTLKFTESMLMENPRRNAKTLQDVKELGVKLAIDHFGTGFSSFGYLKHLPLDELKFDRSLLKDIPENPDSAAIVAATIELAHGMGLKVVAEGVETKQQLAFLKERGCDEYHGRLSCELALAWLQNAGRAAGGSASGGERVEATGPAADVVGGKG